MLHMRPLHHPSCIVPPSYADSSVLLLGIGIAFPAVARMQMCSMLLLLVLLSWHCFSSSAVDGMQMSIGCTALLFHSSGWYADEVKLSAPIQRGNPKLPSPQTNAQPLLFHLQHTALRILFIRLDDMLLLIVLQHHRPHRRERIAIPSLLALPPPNTLPAY